MMRCRSGSVRAMAVYGNRPSSQINRSGATGAWPLARTSAFSNSFLVMPLPASAVKSSYLLACRNTSTVLRWGVDGDEGLFIKTFVTDDDGMGMKLPYKEAGPRHLGPTERCHPPSSRQKKASKPIPIPAAEPTRRWPEEPHRQQQVHAAAGQPPTSAPCGPPASGSGSGDVIGKRPYNLRAAGPGQR
jgi:hypothetical protein